MIRTNQKLNVNGVEFILYEDDKNEKWVSAYEVCEYLDLFPGNTPAGIKRYFPESRFYKLENLEGNGGGKRLFISPLLCHNLFMISRHGRDYQNLVYDRMQDLLTIITVS